MADRAEGIRARLESAAEGLVYSSESDRPFEFFSLGRVSPHPVSKERFAELVGAPATGRVDEKTLDDFLMRHIETSDPYDTRGQEIRPRYERLKEVIRDELEDVRVYRLGSVEVSCYIVGTDGMGNTTGLRTVAIET